MLPFHPLVLSQTDKEDVKTRKEKDSILQLVQE